MSAHPSGGSATVSSEATDLRNKVVDILSSTMNGCLNELGYFPGLPQTLRRAQEYNAKLLFENKKLFEDNHQLTMSLEKQNERLRLAAAPQDAANLTQIAQLQNQIHALTAQRAELQKTNEALVARGPSDSTYQQLANDYRSLAERYSAACNELMQWRHRYVAVNVANPMPQAQPLTARPLSGDPTVSSHALPSQRRVSDGGAQTHAQIVHVDPSMASLGPPPHVQLNRSQNPVHPSTELQKHTPTVINPNHRPDSSSLSVQNRPQPTFPMYSLAPQSHVPSQGPQSLPYHTPVFGTPSQIMANPNYRLSRPSPLPPQNYPQPVQTTERRPSANAQSPPGVLLHQPYHHRMTIPVPSNASKPSGLPNDPIDVDAHALPSTMSQNHPQQRQQFPAPYPPVVQQSHSTSNISPQQQYYALKQPQMGLSQPRPWPAPSASAAYPRGEHLVTSPTASGGLPSPAESFEAITPIDHAKEDTSLVVIASAVPDSEDALKRPNSRMTDRSPDPSEDSRKKPRLGNEPLEVYRESPQIENGTVANAEVQNADENEEEDSNVVTTADTDGYLTVEDCISALIDDENVEGVQTCRLCTARYDMALTTDRPKPFVHATTAELEDHFSKEHSDAWSELRRGVDN